MSKIQAIVLAGGKGSRLRPYTTVLPKSLVPVCETPIAEVIIRQLKFYGINNIDIATGHMSDLIKAYFKNGSNLGVNIKYVEEKEPLGTAGAIKLVKNLADDFLVINGDTLTDMDFKELLKSHKKNKSMATISIKRRTVKTDFGVVESDSNGNFINYIEKPTYRTDVSLGVNILKKECQKYIKKNERIDMPDLLLRLQSKDKKVSCYKTNKTWLDLGRPEDLHSAQDIFKKNEKKFMKTK